MYQFIYFQPVHSECSLMRGQNNKRFDYHFILIDYFIIKNYGVCNTQWVFPNENNMYEMQYFKVELKEIFEVHVYIRTYSNVLRLSLIYKWFC